MINNNWIYVSDMLPKSGDEIYIKDKDGKYFIGIYKNDNFYDGYGKIDNVEMWRNINPWGM